MTPTQPTPKPTIRCTVCGGYYAFGHWLCHCKETIQMRFLITSFGEFFDSKCSQDMLVKKRMEDLGFEFSLSGSPGDSIYLIDRSPYKNFSSLEEVICFIKDWGSVTIKYRKDAPIIEINE